MASRMSRRSRRRSRWGRWLTIGVVLVIAGAIGRQVYRIGTAPVETEADRRIEAELLKARATLLSTLPQKLDEVTTLVDVKVSGRTMEYINEVTVPLSADDLDRMRRDVLARVCASRMRDGFAFGFSYSYSYRMPKTLTEQGRFTFSSCP